MLCSFCQEEIQDGAIKCKHCGSILTGIERSYFSENFSGMGKDAIVPTEIQKWNWGAFFLSWIWGLGNRTYIALLALVPIANIIMAVVLGVKGSEWAWRNKRWESIEHFRKVQRSWTRWGVGIFIAALVIGILANMG